jgi:hypothetical protein
MKPIYLIPLLFLSACSTQPKLVLRPQSPSSTATDAVRYPETVRAYHFGRYVDPSDDLVMHEQHVVFRVEENARWDLHPVTGKNDFSPTPSPHDAAFSPLPVNEAMLAEVNAQKLATIQIMAQAQVLSGSLAQFQSALQQAKANMQETAMLRANIGDLKRRLDALEDTPPAGPTFSTTNAAPDPLAP